MPTPKESTGRTLLVAFVLCLVCSVFVSGAAVSLKPVHTSNKVLDRKKNILAAAGMYSPGAHSAAGIEESFGRFSVKMVDLDSGTVLDAAELASRGLDPELYDQLRAAKDPALSRELAAEEDIAGIKRRENIAQVYLLQDEGKLQKIVLPVRGYGLWSTLYGFLVLAGDANTVVGLAYYDQKETPGLGGEIGNPAWQALWVGRHAFDEQGLPKIAVIKGQAGPPEKDPLRVDGMSGATITSNAITRLTQFWLSDDGYGKFLKKFKAGGLA